MDPNEALKRAREAFRQAFDAEDESQHHQSEEFERALDLYREAAACYAALDEWLANGGFQPDWA